MPQSGCYKLAQISGLIALRDSKSKVIARRVVAVRDGSCRYTYARLRRLSPRAFTRLRPTESCQGVLSGGRVQGGRNVVDRRLFEVANVLSLLAVGGRDFVGQVDDELAVLLHLNWRGLAF